MKEYIERAAALDTIGVQNNRIWNEVYDLPTANVVEVRHGRWILEREPDGTPYCFHCSVCDSDFRHIGIMSATDFCPDCGARMDKEDEHEAD